MIVFPTTDVKKIKSVLCDEWIYNRISEDGTPSAEEYEPPTDAVYLTDSDLSGLVIYQPINAASFEFHIQMLDRSKGVELGLSCIKWLWDNSDAIKIVTQVPEIYPEVCNFAGKIGFEKEGINRSSYLKGGKVYSQIYYGLIKPEV